MKNSTSGDVKMFNTCIESFVCAFIRPDTLMDLMNKAAEEVAKTWNERNSCPTKKFTRNASTKIIPLDVRSNPVRGSKKNKNIELVLAATTYNYTRDVQNLDSICICAPENVYFQLRFQYNDKHAVANMLSLNLTDWTLFLTNHNLHEFCEKLFKKYPITSKYVQRIETYYNSEKSDKNKVDTNPDKNMDIFSKVDEAAPRTDSDEDIDVDDPQPETKKLIKKQ